MPIKNMTSNRILAMSSRTADSALARSLGLMFSKAGDAALILKFESEQRISLHMYFVFYPIDVIFVNGRKRIVEVKEGFKPFEMYSSGKKAKYAIELPQGTVKQTKTKVGDAIEFLMIRERNHLNGRSITIMKG